MGKLLLIALIVFGAALSVFAQDGGLGERYAAVIDGELVIVNADGTTVTVNTDAQARSLFNLRWSPDGTKLAYFAQDAQFNTQIYIADTATGESFSFPHEPLEVAFPLVWLADGRLLYAAQPDYSQVTAMGMTVPVRLFAAYAQEGGNSELFTVINVGVGCGGGSPYPSDWRYSEETGFGGSPQFLALTDYGLLYTPSCGGAGLELLDLNTGNVITLVSGEYSGTEGVIGRAALSPDGTQLAAVRSIFGTDTLDNRVVLIRLPDAEITELPSAADVDQVAWSADGSAIYYSTRTLTGNLADTLTDEGLNRLASALYYPSVDQVDVPAYEAALHRYDLATGEDAILHTAPAWSFARIREMADGSVVFSQVAGLEAWVAAIADGSLDLTNPSGIQIDTRAYTPVDVYQVRAGESAVQVAANAAQITFAP